MKNTMTNERERETTEEKKALSITAIFPTFLPGGPLFSFYTEPHKLCSQFC